MDSLPILNNGGSLCDVQTAEVFGSNFGSKMMVAIRSLCMVAGYDVT